jgi:hypothetical protein
MELPTSRTTAVVRLGDDFLYVFKGARSAPTVRSTLISEAHPRATADGGRCPSCQGRRTSRGPSRAPAAFLWPWRATSAPSRTASPLRSTGLVPSANRGAGPGKLRSLRRLILKPRKIAVKGARYARVASRRPLTASLVEDSEAPIGRMAGSERFLTHLPRHALSILHKCNK